MEASVELSKNILQTDRPTDRPTDISLYRSSLPELKKSSKKLDSTDLTKCFLPTTDIMNELPFFVEAYQMPENVDDILKRDGIDDDILELCMQETLIKGNILTNFEDINTSVCLPKQVVDEMYCPTRIRSKYGILT